MWLLACEPSTSATASGTRASTKPTQECLQRTSSCASERISNSTQSLKKTMSLTGAMSCGGTTKSRLLKDVNRTRRAIAMRKSHLDISLTVYYLRHANPPIALKQHPLCAKTCSISNSRTQSKRLSDFSDFSLSLEKKESLCFQIYTILAVF